jgi:lysylphosphatidylglycerol synthetase-like protein (DUF2156 family)
MEETNFVRLWNEQNEKIDQSLVINKRFLKEIISQKAESQVYSLIKSKVIGIVLAIVYLIVLGISLYYAMAHFSPALYYFVLSIGAIFLINIKALYDYIKHLIWLNTIDYQGSLTEIQQKLNRLHLSIVQHIRVTFLQLPFWTTFYLSSNWFPKEMGWGYIVFQLLLTGTFTYVAYFFYRNLTLVNLHKKWVKSLLSGAGGKKVMNALTFYKEIETYKADT